MNKNTVKRILRRNPSYFSKQDSEGITLLHRLAWNNHAELLELILAAGVDPNIKDKNGETPLHGAVASEAEEACAVLITYGAEKGALDKDGLPPSHWLERYPNQKIKDLIFGSIAN